jgi:hypothetical protein
MTTASLQIVNRTLIGESFTRCYRVPPRDCVMTFSVH